MNRSSKINRIDITFILWPRIAPFCGPLYFGTSAKSTNDVKHSGTFGLVNTGQTKLLVTNAHVLDGFEVVRRAQPNLKLFVCLHGGHQIVLNVDKPSGYSRLLDLVTFDLTGSESQIPTHHFCEMDIPVRQLAIGDKTLSIGYPGCFRKTSDAPLIEFAAVPMALNVTRVVGTTAFMADIMNAEYDDAILKENPHAKLGGISGSPCFFVRDAVTKPSLVGFAKESRPLFGVKHEIAFTHASRIKPNGSVDDS